MRRWEGVDCDVGAAVVLLLPPCWLDGCPLALPRVVWVAAVWAAAAAAAAAAACWSTILLALSDSTLKVNCVLELAGVA